jgi:RNA polymerase sigma-70 factor (ECF subfamily)
MADAAVRGILAAMRAKTPGDGAPGDDEDGLVRRARSGDRRAFDRLVANHLPQVWATVWRMLRHREDTEDVVQEVFVTAHRSLTSFRGDARFSTWLHRIATTRALNHLERAEEKLRRASDSIDLHDEDGPGAARAAGAVLAMRGTTTPLHALEAKELMRRLAECLRALPAAWRAVLALRDGEGRTYEQIAEALHVELGTVRSRLARARSSLKDCVEGRAA